MEKVMGNKSHWLIIVLIFLIALAAIGLSQYKYYKLSYNVAVLKHNMSTAKTADQASRAWEGFVKATTPALRGKQSSAYKEWIGDWGGWFGGGATGDCPYPDNPYDVRNNPSACYGVPGYGGDSSLAPFKIQ